MLWMTQRNMNPFRATHFGNGRRSSVASLMHDEDGNRRRLFSSSSVGGMSSCGSASSQACLSLKPYHRVLEPPRAVSTVDSGSCTAFTGGMCGFRSSTSRFGLKGTVAQQTVLKSVHVICSSRAAMYAVRLTSYMVHHASRGLMQANVHMTMHAGFNSVLVVRAG